VVETVSVDAAAVESPPSVATARTIGLALAAVYIVWGSTYFAMRIVVETVPPFFMAGVRFLVTGSLMALFLRARGSAWPSKREWLAAAPVGLLMFVLGNGTVAYAEKHISSGVAAVVCGTMPLWVAALGPLFGERPTRRELVGLVLGFLGVGALSFGDALSGDPFSAAVLLLAPISWALGSLLARRLPLPKGAMSSAAQMLIGGVAMALLSPLFGESVPSEISSRALMAWVYLGVFGSFVAYTAYMYLLRTTRPAVATSYSYVNPAIAVIIGAAFGGEQLRVEMVVALMLIVSATVIVVMKPGAVKTGSVTLRVK
jgi:drug/metabolite transporter (DMT)-like permease